MSPQESKSKWSIPRSKSDVEVIYKTISIVNQQFIAARDWEHINLNKKTGEDINSEYFGGIYYPPKVKGSGLIEQRPTIAKESMEIEIDLINESDDNWILESISLKVLNTFDIAQIPYEAGSWKIGKRTLDYNPNFEIRADGQIVIDIPKEFILWRKDEFRDSRIILEVYTEESKAMLNKVFEFDFELSFTKSGSQKERVKINSDKTYFIGSV